MEAIVKSLESVNSRDSSRELLPFLNILKEIKIQDIQNQNFRFKRFRSCLNMYYLKLLQYILTFRLSKKQIIRKRKHIFNEDANRMVLFFNVSMCH